MNYHKNFFYLILHLCLAFNLILQVQSNFNTENTIDEKKARNLVKILLEKDISYYKNLIPTINTFNSEDFMNLFDGNSDHNYNTPKIANIKRLAYKFENFSPILYEFYKDNNFYEYLIELWVEYPNMDNLKALKDAKKISSELSSILPNYSSWPDDVKEKLMKPIINTQLVCKEIKEKIEKEYPDIDAVLKNLTKIYKIFSEIKDVEYLTKNKNIYYNYFLNGFLEKINKNISFNISFTEFINITKNSIPKNFELDGDKIFHLILNLVVNKENIKGIIELYKKVSDDKSIHIENINEEYIDNIISIKNLTNMVETTKQWLIVAKNFYYCIYRGQKLYETIQLYKKLGGDNEYQKRLDKI